jgi:hypothetical protein
MPPDFAGPFPYPSYPPLPDWHSSPSMVETAQTASIPNHPRLSPLPPLPITHSDSGWEDVNYPTGGTNTQSTSSSPAHSPFRDTPTPVDQPEVGRKEKSGREDATVRRTPRIGTYERAWKTGTASGLACGSNLLTARQTPHRPRTFVDTRHRSRTPDSMSKVVISSYGTSNYSRLAITSSSPAQQPKLIHHYPYFEFYSTRLGVGRTPAPSAVGPGATKARGTTTESANMVMCQKSQKGGFTTTLRWKAVLLRITRI